MILALLFTHVLHAAILPLNSADTHTREYDIIGVTRVEVFNPAGKVKISPTDTHKVYITTQKRKFPEQCKVTVEKSLDNSTILAKLEGEKCEVDFDLKVPVAVDIKVASGAGSVEITGVEGRLAFDVGSGSLKANGTFKKVEGNAGSGDVSVSGLAGDGNVKVGSGSVDVTIKGDPKGELLVETGTGDAVVNIPKGNKLKAELASAVGEASSDVLDSATAEYSVSLKSGAGDVKVKTY